MAFFSQRARRIAFPDHHIDKNTLEHVYPVSLLPTYDVNRTNASKRLRRSAGVGSFIEALEQDGCVIVEDFTQEESLARADAEIQQSNRNTTDDAVGENVLAENKAHLVRHSRTLREDFFADTLYHSLAEHFLTVETTSWHDTRPLKSTSRPLLSSAKAIAISPSRIEALHRADSIHHHHRHVPITSYPPSNPPNRDVLLGMFIPSATTSASASRFTATPGSTPAPTDTGATIRVVPGSHLWGDDRPAFSHAGHRDIVKVDLRPGEAMVMLGSLYYALGASLSRSVHFSSPPSPSSSSSSSSSPPSLASAGSDLSSEHEHENQTDRGGGGGVCDCDCDCDDVEGQDEVGVGADDDHGNDEEENRERKGGTGTGGRGDREIYAIFSCSGHLRQEDHSDLTSLSREEVEGYSKAVRDRLGVDRGVV